MDRRFNLSLLFVLLAALLVIGLAVLLPQVELAQLATPNALLPFALSLVVMAVFARRPA